MSTTQNQRPRRPRGRGPAKSSAARAAPNATVQAKTLQPILSGADVLAQAKTGTGKTLAFLVPAIQNLTSSSQRPPQSQTTILVLSPTRELAIQIADAATGICNALPAAADVGVQVVVGGTNISSDVSRMKRSRTDILIATPGRLVDLLENYSLGARLSQLRCLVLDEADRLLDQGFRNELNENLERSTEEEHRLQADLALQRYHPTERAPEDLNTHERVDQHYRAVPLQDLIASSVQILLEEYEKQGDEFKVMCFLPTARAAAMHYDIFQNLQLSKPLTTWEIHSRMSQSKRTKVTEEFRDAKTGILFSSDVVARGIDIPGVSLMFIGLDEQPAQVPKATASSSSADFELPFVSTPDMRQLPLQPLPSSSPATITLAQAHALIQPALLRVEDDAKAQAGIRIPFIATANFYAKNCVVVSTREEMGWHRRFGQDVTWEGGSWWTGVVSLEEGEAAAAAAEVVEVVAEEVVVAVVVGVVHPVSKEHNISGRSWIGRDRQQPQQQQQQQPQQQSRGPRRGGFRGRGRPRGGPPP
ncbi:P-loop containing nucleoside triphosphate hydrolase protein [Coprinopsis sp. MPI-PUGE-AT-0042]|nr:P-loop containing nucleoside triphosphate hydrolase protein [Coprinopsis sp. MPI-PUGE-AT-0042]